MTTIAETIEHAAALLAPSPTAHRDAELLLLHTTRMTKADLLTHPEHELTERQTNHYQAAIARRALHEPVQYIIGTQEFYGRPFIVNPLVLIPRPETEHLVETVVALARSFAAPRIVDIGAGSGAISVALAHHLPKARITTTDLSEAALAIARENVRSNGVADRICFLQGDLLAPLAGEKFDIIVSNPPYVPARDRDSLSVEVREYEPLLALFAGEDGLDIYRRLIPAAFVALTSGGFIALEIGYGQADAVQNFLRAAGFAQIEFTPDLQSIPRVAAAQRP